MFFLSKLVPLLIYPAGLACLMLLAALVLRRRARWRTGLVVAALLVIWLSGNRIVAMATARSLEWRIPPLAAGTQGDVIVVLGGATRAGFAPRPTHEVNEAGDRLLYALHLWKAGAAPKILATGGNVELLGPSGQSEAAVMAELLETMGVPRSALLLEEASRNTWENATGVQAILDEEGMERVLLVTSAMHMPRAAAIFHKLGIDVIPAPTDYLVTRADWQFYLRRNLSTQLFNLVPSADDLRLTTLALREWIGIFTYRLRGWL